MATVRESQLITRNRTNYVWHLFSLMMILAALKQPNAVVLFRNLEMGTEISTQAFGGAKISTQDGFC
jgi:ligand-binding SRPBCC domain-containing protein